MGWIRKNNKRSPENNNRANFIAAIIFISGFIAIGQLVHLQIFDYDYYRSAAARQQEANGVLPAKRGKIYIQDQRAVNSKPELYPIATNRGLATVFAHPAAVNEPGKTAEKLFEIFDSANIAAEVEQRLLEDE